MENGMRIEMKKKVEEINKDELIKELQKENKKLKRQINSLKRMLRKG